jgi:hypothetical protein
MLKIASIFTGLLLFLVIKVASQSFENESLFQKISSRSSKIKFKNALKETSHDNMLSFINFYTGSGVGILDANNDNLPDIFFGGNQVSSRLYLNKGDFQFEDITEQSGLKTDRWITGVSIVDINQDGFDDIYLSVSGAMDLNNTKNLLFINSKDNTFSEKAQEYNLDQKEQITHTSFFDYDRDGDLDVYMAVNPTDFKLNAMEALKKPQVKGSARSTDKLFRNNGNGKFIEVSEESGILVEGYSLGINTSDFNHDGWIDIYVSNDYLGNDILYINNGDGTFTNRLNEFIDYTSFASMGNDAGDINNDGLIDIISLDMLPESSYRRKMILGSPSYKGYLYTLSLGYQPSFSRNMLQLNNGDGTFSEIGQMAGIHQSGWSWAPILVDLDNDGYKDLFITTGFRRDMGNLDFINHADHSPFKRGGNTSPTMQLEAIKKVDGVSIINYAYKNDHNLTFTKVSSDWGFGEKTYSSGVTIADLDLDGDNDIIINNIDREASIYENRSELIQNSNYIKICLQGRDGNRNAYGSKINIYYGDNVQYIDHNPYRGYMSTVDNTMLFGLGEYTLVDSIIVNWLDGFESRIYKVKNDSTVVIQQKSAIVDNTIKSLPKNNNSINFKEISSELDIFLKHKENSHSDFYTQPLLPHQHSKLGPAIAVGDINDDGLEDFFIGGSRGNHGTIFYQNLSGIFHTKIFPYDRKYEDMGALLFDFDKDGDLDLYIVSGGTYSGSNSDLYQDRLYLNTGSGEFIKTEHVLPEINSSGSVVTAADFDGDDDLDLFVGGRISPKKYPLAPRSFLLENRNGKFIDITPEKAPGLQYIGMVTSALWTDFTLDGAVDLLIIGEWMPVTVYKNYNGNLENLTEELNLNYTSGWWNSISSGDFNGDGILDYMLGNLGENNGYNASLNKPLKIVAKDFNNNGIYDQIISRSYSDGIFPIVSRSTFLSVFPQKKKKYPTYEQYANTDSKNLLKDLGTDNTIELEAGMFSNSILFHYNNDSFKIQPIPNRGQVAPIFGTHGADLNENSETNFLLIGNFNSNNHNDGPYSAFTGGLISCSPNDKIKFECGHAIGFNVPSDGKALANLVLGTGENIFIVTSNNDNLKVFQPLKFENTQIKLNQFDVFAIIEDDNGRKYKQEFYYGSGYLSQSSRFLTLNSRWKKIELISYSGKRRILTRENEHSWNLQK